MALTWETHWCAMAMYKLMPQPTSFATLMVCVMDGGQGAKDLDMLLGMLGVCFHMVVIPKVILLTQPLILWVSRSLSLPLSLSLCPPVSRSLARSLSLSPSTSLSLSLSLSLLLSLALSLPHHTLQSHGLWRSHSSTCLVDSLRVGANVRDVMRCEDAGVVVWGAVAQTEITASRVQGCERQRPIHG
jgi:hypothetical protein